MTRVAILLTDGFADWEYAILAGAGRTWFGLEIAYFAPGPAVSMGGLAVQARSLEELPAWAPAILAIIGGTIWDTPEAPDLSDQMQALHANGGTVAAICGGTLALARSGLLNTRKHTSNDPDYIGTHVSGYAGAVHYIDTPKAVTDDHVITAPGTAPVTFTAEVLRAAGIDDAGVMQFLQMMGAEHGDGA